MATVRPWIKAERHLNSPDWSPEEISIAANVRINPGNHPMERASQSHFTSRASRYFPGEADEEAFFDLRRSHAVAIGPDVWIGHSAVVAAGAIVTKDVALYMIVAGNPAKPIRPRFPADVADALQRLAGWDWSHEQLRDALPDFRQLLVAEFLVRHA